MATKYSDSERKYAEEKYGYKFNDQGELLQNTPQVQETQSTISDLDALRAIGYDPKQEKATLTERGTDIAKSAWAGLADQVAGGAYAVGRVGKEVPIVGDSISKAGFEAADYIHGGAKNLQENMGESQGLKNELEQEGITKAKAGRVAGQLIGGLGIQAPITVIGATTGGVKGAAAAAGGLGGGLTALQYEDQRAVELKAKNPTMTLNQAKAQAREEATKLGGVFDQSGVLNAATQGLGTKITAAKTAAATGLKSQLAAPLAESALNAAGAVGDVAIGAQGLDKRPEMSDYLLAGGLGAAASYLPGVLAARSVGKVNSKVGDASETNINEIKNNSESFTKVGTDITNPLNREQASKRFEFLQEQNPTDKHVLVPAKDAEGNDISDRFTIETYRPNEGYTPKTTETTLDSDGNVIKPSENFVDDEVLRNRQQALDEIEQADKMNYRFDDSEYAAPIQKAESEIINLDNNLVNKVAGLTSEDINAVGPIGERNRLQVDAAIDNIANKRNFTPEQLLEVRSQNYDNKMNFVRGQLDDIANNNIRVQNTINNLTAASNLAKQQDMAKFAENLPEKEAQKFADAKQKGLEKGLTGKNAVSIENFKFSKSAIDKARVDETNNLVDIYQKGGVSPDEIATIKQNAEGKTLKQIKNENIEAANRFSKELDNKLLAAGKNSGEDFGETIKNIDLQDLPPQEILSLKRKELDKVEKAQQRETNKLESGIKKKLSAMDSEAKPDEIDALYTAETDGLNLKQLREKATEIQSRKSIEKKVEKEITPKKKESKESVVDKEQEKIANETIKKEQAAIKEKSIDLDNEIKDLLYDLGNRRSDLNEKFKQYSGKNNEEKASVVESLRKDLESQRQEKTLQKEAKVKEVAETETDKKLKASKDLKSITNDKDFDFIDKKFGAIKEVFENDTSNSSHKGMEVYEPPTKLEQVDSNSTPKGQDKATKYSYEFKGENNRLVVGEDGNLKAEVSLGINQDSPTAVARGTTGIDLQKLVNSKANIQFVHEKLNPENGKIGPVISVYADGKKIGYLPREFIKGDFKKIFEAGEIKSMIAQFKLEGMPTSAIVKDSAKGKDVYWIPGKDYPYRVKLLLDIAPKTKGFMEDFKAEQMKGVGRLSVNGEATAKQINDVITKSKESNLTKKENRAIESSLRESDPLGDITGDNLFVRGAGTLNDMVPNDAYLSDFSRKMNEHFDNDKSAMGYADINLQTGQLIRIVDLDRIRNSWENKAPGTASFNSLADYAQYVAYHETGHAIGFMKYPLGTAEGIAAHKKFYTDLYNNNEIIKALADSKERQGYKGEDKNVLADEALADVFANRATFLKNGKWVKESLEDYIAHTFRGDAKTFTEKVHNFWNGIKEAINNLFGRDIMKISEYKFKDMPEEAFKAVKKEIADMYALAKRHAETSPYRKQEADFFDNPKISDQTKTNMLDLANDPWSHENIGLEANNFENQNPFGRYARDLSAATDDLKTLERLKANIVGTFKGNAKSKLEGSDYNSKLFALNVAHITDPKFKKGMDSIDLKSKLKSVYNTHISGNLAKTMKEANLKGEDLKKVEALIASQLKNNKLFGAEDLRKSGYTEDQIKYISALNQAYITSFGHRIKTDLLQTADSFGRINENDFQQLLYNIDTLKTDDVYKQMVEFINKPETRYNKDDGLNQLLKDKLIKKLDKVMKEKTKAEQEGVIKFLTQIRPYGTHYVAVKNGSGLESLKFFHSEGQADRFIAAEKSKKGGDKKVYEQNRINESLLEKKYQKDIDPDAPVKPNVSVEKGEGTYPLNNYLKITNDNNSNVFKVKDITKTQLEFFKDVANGYVSKVFDGRFEAYVKTLDNQGYGDIAESLRLRNSIEEKPQNSLTSFVGGSTSLLQLSGSIANAAINATSVLLNNPFYFAAKGGAYGTKAWLKSLDVARKGSLLGLVGSKEWKDKPLQNKAEYMVERFVDKDLLKNKADKDFAIEAYKKIIQRGITDEIGDLDAMKGLREMINTSNVIGRTTSKVLAAGMKPAAITEGFNRLSTAIAAVNIGLKDKAKNKITHPEELYTFAKDAIYQTQGSYAKYSYPEWTAKVPLGTLMWQFKVFTGNQIALGKTLARDNPKAALLYALTNTTLMGLAGLPGADLALDGGEALYNRFADKDINLKKWLNDTTEGTVFNMFLNGVFNDRENDTLDVSRRYGAQNFIPMTNTALSIIKGEESSKVVQSLAKDVGAFTNAGLGIVSGVRELTKEDENASIPERIGKAAKASGITVAANAAKAVEMVATDKVTNFKGDAVGEGFNAFDVALQAASFQPAKVTAKRREIEEATKVKQQFTEYEKKINANFVEAAITDDPDRSLEKLNRANDLLFKYNEANPDNEIRINNGALRRAIRSKDQDLFEKFLKNSPPELRETFKAGFDKYNERFKK